MFIKHFTLMSVFCLTAVAAGAQVGPESKTIILGQQIEHDIAGGESHKYQISLTVGQSARLVLEQKAIDVTLVLASPDIMQIAEVNLTAAGGLESLSIEVAASGEHRLTVRAASAATLAGSYKVRLELKAAATSPDRQRIAAERWLLEAFELRKQGGKTADQAIGKLQQAV